MPKKIERSLEPVVNSEEGKDDVWRDFGTFDLRFETLARAILDHSRTFLFVEPDLINNVGEIERDAYRTMIEMRPFVCVDIVLFNQRLQSYLLVKRKTPPAQGAWWLPGGRLYKGETFSQCCVRKCFKEIGLIVETVAILGFAQTQFPDSMFGTPTHSINIHVLAVLTDPLCQPKIDASCCESFEWKLITQPPEDAYVKMAYYAALDALEKLDYLHSSTPPMLANMKFLCASMRVSPRSTPPFLVSPPPSPTESYLSFDHRLINGGCVKSITDKGHTFAYLDPEHIETVIPTDKLPYEFLPIVCVDVCLFNLADHSYLQVRKSKPPMQGAWRLPSGILYKGESFSQSCVRICKEETGLEVRSIVAYDITQTISSISERHQAQAHIVHVAVLAIMESIFNQVSGSENYEEYVWAPIREQPEDAFLARAQSGAITALEKTDHKF